MRVLLPLSLVLGLLCLTSCSGDKKATSKSGQSSSFERRMRMPNMNQESQFQKAFNTGSNSKGDYFSGKGFKTGKFAGLKDYKTMDFTQAGKTSNFANKVAQWGKEESSMGQQKFGTKDSAMSGMTAQMGGKSYSGADSTYKTGSFQPAAKSIAKDARPQMIGTPNNAPTAYSEEEIARLINR